MHDTSERFTLRQLPLPAKLVVSVFLCSVGLGYFSALIQLHFKQADAGSFMPTPKNVIRAYHGELPELPLTTLIVADESLPFSGTGSMRKAFTSKTDGWREDVAARGEKELRREREGEILSVLAWIKAEPTRREAYENNHLPIPAEVEALTAEFKTEDGKGVKVKSIIDARCARCHKPDGEDENAAQYPLDGYEKIAKYMTVVPAGRMSSDKLAQSTHAHLLTFCVLFGLTGIIFAFSSYPVWFRCLLAPLVLFMQVIDVSFWWLARIDGPVGEMFALGIMLTGGLVGMGLFFQIVLSLFNMFSASGRAVLVGLFLAAGVGGFVAKTKYLDKYLEAEKKAATIQAAEEKE